MTSELLLRLSVILVGFIIVGTAACLPLYRWNVRDLLASSLFVKILWWIPIFLVLILILYGGLTVAIAVTAVVILLGLREFIRNRGWSQRFASLYFILFLIWTAHLAWWYTLPESLATPLLIAVAVMSVVSDVCAFFFGNYLGHHNLPHWLNRRKSWEGVAGQIIGAGIGALLAIFFLSIPLSLGLILAIGVASASGDLINSAAKRSLSIRDWGRTIPGHGGVMDRMSSLSLSITVAYWTTFAFYIMQ